MDDAGFFTWLDAAAQKDPKLAALVATLNGQSVENLPLPLCIELTDSPAAVDVQPSPASSRSGEPDAVAKRFIDPDVTFVPQKIGPILAFTKPAAPEVEPTWSAFDLDAAERSAAWRRAHGLPVNAATSERPVDGSVTFSDSEREDMPRGPLGSG
jgi:hypothetical protein